MPLLAVFLYCPSDFVESNWTPWSRPQLTERYPPVLSGTSFPGTHLGQSRSPPVARAHTTRNKMVLCWPSYKETPQCLTIVPSPEPKDTVTSPQKPMASTTASAASWMDTSSSSPTVGNQGPVVSQAFLSRPLGHVCSHSSG